MAVNTEIFENRNLIIHYFSENISREIITETIDNTLLNPKFKMGMDAIWCVEVGTHVEMSSDDAKIISKHARKAFDQDGACYKLALVASDDFAYGMSRVYEGWSNDRPVDIQTFRKIEDALKWIE